MLVKYRRCGPISGLFMRLKDDSSVTTSEHCRDKTPLRRGLPLFQSPNLRAVSALTSSKLFL